MATVSTFDEHARVAEDTPVCVGDADDVTVAYGLRQGADAGIAGPTTLDLDRRGQVARTAGESSTSATHGSMGGASPMMHPRLAREPDGAIDLAFYAAGPTPDTSALRWMRAADDKTPLLASKVARDHFLFEPSPKEAAWGGSYFGWAWRDNALYAASIDSSASLPHVAFTKIPSR